MYLLLLDPSSALRLAIVASAITVLSSSARADVLISNIDVPIRSVTTVSQELWAGQSFATDGQAYKLTSIDLLLGALAGAPSLVAELHADAAGSPGSTLARYLLAGIGAGAPALFTMPGSFLDLSANTTYWIVLGATGRGSFGWAYAEGNSQAGPGSIGAYRYSSDAGGSWGGAGTDNPYNVRINVAAVPEPQTVTLILLGLLGLGACRFLAHRRRGRS